MMIYDWVGCDDDTCGHEGCDGCSCKGSDLACDEIDYVRRCGKCVHFRTSACDFFGARSDDSACSRFAEDRS